MFPCFLSLLLFWLLIRWVPILARAFCCNLNVVLARGPSASSEASRFAHSRVASSLESGPAAVCFATAASDDDDKSDFVLIYYS